MEEIDRMTAYSHVFKILGIKTQKNENYDPYSFGVSLKNCSEQNVSYSNGTTIISDKENDKEDK